jgi:type IV fimbrial biogenesis protein FimT
MSARRTRGFTLIELMVTLTVIVVLLLIAMPSFSAFRQRSALRAGAEQAVSFWNQARFEAAKRNTYVKVGYVTSGGNYCMGAATTTDATDHVACDCTTAGACNVAQWPNSQTEWAGVTISGTPTMGPTGNEGVAIIEPKRTSITDSGDEGAVTFAGPPGTYSYKLNVVVDRFGRINTCESTSAAAKLSDYIDRRCSP